MTWDKGIPRGRQDIVGAESSCSLLVFHALPTLPVGWSVGRGLSPQRHEAELGPDSAVHLPERPGHGRGGRGQKEAADWGQEASRPLSHQIAQGGRPAHALHGG